MLYAHNNQISSDPIPGGIEISQAQYNEALAGMQGGKGITIEGGFAVIDPPKPDEPEVPEAEEPDPISPRLTSLAFIELFADHEQLAIVTATMANPVIKLWYDKLLAADDVVFDDPRLLTGMDALVSFELITAARRDEILGITQL